MNKKLLKLGTLFLSSFFAITALAEGEANAELIRVTFDTYENGVTRDSLSKGNKSLVTEAVRDLGDICESIATREKAKSSGGVDLIGIRYDDNKEAYYLEGVCQYLN